MLTGPTLKRIDCPFAQGGGAKPWNGRSGWRRAEVGERWKRLVTPIAGPVTIWHSREVNALRTSVFPRANQMGFVDLSFSPLHHSQPNPSRYGGDRGQRKRRGCERRTSNGEMIVMIDGGASAPPPVTRAGIPT